MIRSSWALSSVTPNHTCICICKPERKLHHRYRQQSPVICNFRGLCSLSSTHHTRVRQFTRLYAFQKGAQSEDDQNVTEEDMWQRVQLLQRLLDVAIAEEDYSQAKTINDQLTALKAQLPESDQMLLEKIHLLTKGSITERTKIIEDLGNTKDKRVLPILANGLFDSNHTIASEIEKAMWKIFMHSGRDDVDRQLQEGLSLMLSNDLPRAKDIFTQVVEMAPSFAEGWNKRATVNYLLRDYKASIKDCEQTLELNPYHFGALSGMGLCYAALNELESALFWFERACAIHPGLVQINKFVKSLKQRLGKVHDDRDDSPQVGS